MRVTLTRDYRKISTSYGLFQNLSGDANVELTENVQSEVNPPPPNHHPPNPYDCFEHKPFPPPEPRPPHDDADGYVIQIPRALIERGQHKFVADFQR